ncbi:cytochrome P450 monooxygenase 107 [Heterobasidion irregulare TC 32-1]|uniref:Cytochrome P450 monooxygenase 107 n=1 Tax=Heterobasidion irregulare (strain TC 32-1) TaxID=747525 RepID=W4JW04_HETIT|nr:cytochrome P450 monooxygenase 107 [Heterobasidion irregulare TC 32-1]ETW77250.1 cytochrome P450 monooxygenase 107 [Heterobasidion irregulare TC 32-1]
MSTTALNCVISLLGLVLFAAYLKRRRNSSGLPFPPGSTPFPFISNVLDIPKRVPWEMYSKWADQYGDIMSIQAFGETMVIISSARMARELLKSVARITLTSPSSLLTKFSLQVEFTMLLVINDLRHSTTAGIVMALTYGYDITDPDDNLIAHVEDIARRASSALLPGSTFINVFPFLLKLQHSKMKGTAHPSIILNTMNSFSENDLTEEEECALKEVAASLYIAGTDTAASALAFFVLAPIGYPEVQKRAQNELDAVVGRERLPQYEDQESLPYINAICQEFLRWRMDTPLWLIPRYQNLLGVPRTSIEDDMYEGFFIPKGSQIVLNTWSMLHGPEAYPDPETFRPERFLRSGGAFVEDPLVNSVYGWGRRICPGIFIANATIWAAVASILSAFDVRKAKDSQGSDIPVNGAYIDQGIICHPFPFKRSITPRDAQAEQLVVATETEME